MDFFARFVVVIIAIFFLLSCATTKDITDNSILRGNYIKGLVLKIKSDILLDEYNFLWDLPQDIERAKQYGFSDDYKGFVREGTKLRILRIELYQHIENGNYIYPMALILNGQWKGEKVNLHYTSRSSDSPHNASYHIDILDFDPEVFEIVKE